MIAATYPEPGKVPSALLAILVHLALFTMLFFGVRWQSKHPDTVVVELWEEPPVEVVKTKPIEVKPEHIPTPPKLEKEVKPDIVIEKAKKKEQQQEEQMKRLLQEQLLRESQALKIEKERQEELQRLKQAEASEKNRQMADYIEKIKAKIKGNTLVPGEIKGNPEAIFDVVQLPSGEIISANLRKSSGYTSYDTAIERAILKSSPLPKPDNPNLFQRNITLKFRPLD